MEGIGGGLVPSIWYQFGFPNGARNDPHSLLQKNDARVKHISPKYSENRGIYLIMDESLTKIISIKKKGIKKSIIVDTFNYYFQLSTSSF